MIEKRTRSITVHNDSIARDLLFAQNTFGNVSICVAFWTVDYANVVSQKCTWLLRRRSPRETNELNIDGVAWHFLDRHGHGHFLLPLSKPDLRLYPTRSPCLMTCEFLIMITLIRRFCRLAGFYSFPLCSLHGGFPVLQHHRRATALPLQRTNFFFSNCDVAQRGIRRPSLSLLCATR